MLAPITVAIFPQSWRVALTAEEDVVALLIHISAMIGEGVLALAVPVGLLDQIEHVVAGLAPDVGVELRLSSEQGGRLLLIIALLSLTGHVN